jgi:hypothetical protein
VVRGEVLHSCLDPHTAEPLEPSVRGFMESRFRAGLGEVLVHTGPAAANLCGTLGARAFAWGRNIAFAAGQYDPSNEAGLRLLAHELVHVLQQRGARPAACRVAVPVGRASDECETEATRLAEQALAGGLQETATPDVAGAIRRVSFESISLVPDTKRSTPAIYRQPIGTGDFQGKAVMHLNEGAFKNDASFFDPDETDEAAVRAASAINIKGSAIVKLAKDEQIDAMLFRFIQVAKLERHEAYYTGCAPAEGDIDIDLTDQNIFDGFGKYLLDSAEDEHNPVFPCIVLRDEKTRSLGDGRFSVTADMDDHPHQNASYLLYNPLSDVNNLLNRVDIAISFFTAFVMMDSAGDVQQIIAHRPWRVHWKASFNWPTGPNGLPHSTLVAGRDSDTRFVVGDMAAGPPPDPVAADTIWKAHKLKGSDTIAVAATNAHDSLVQHAQQTRAAVNSSAQFIALGDAFQINKVRPASRSPGPNFCGR